MPKSNRREKPHNLRIISTKRVLLSVYAPYLKIYM